jgi:hypothetical protein
MHDSFFDSDTPGEFPESPLEKQGVPRFFPGAQARRPGAPRTETQHRKELGGTDRFA